MTKNKQKERKRVFLWGEDSNSYNGWLNSDSFEKRAIAIALYGSIGSLLLYITVVLPLFFLTYVFF